MCEVVDLVRTITKLRASRADLGFWIAAIGCIGLITLSVTTESIWIDEGWIAWVVSHQSLGEVVAALKGPALPSPTDLQYPLYLLWEWLWVRIYGSSEYALRASNLPFAAVFVVALALTSRHALGRKFAWIPFAFSPFVWFYMNEARPYIMLTSFATCAAGSLLVYRFGAAEAKTRALPLVLPTILLAWLSHILAVIALPGFLVLILSARHDQGLFTWTRWRHTILIWALPFVAVAVFYGATLTGSGIRSEISANSRASAGPIAFLSEDVYEQLGFNGLGPPRNALRANHGFLVFKPYVGFLSLTILLMVFVSFLALRRGVNRESAILIAAWIGCIAFGTVVADATHGRFLARHMSATIPFLLFTCVSMIRTRLGLLILACIFVVSDARLSLLPEYAKDDYRSATMEIISRYRAQPGSIDWAADDLSANYYGLALTNGANSGSSAVTWPVLAKGIRVVNWDAGEVDALVKQQLSSGRPVYVALSKPDLYDRSGAWRSTVEERRGTSVARFEAFEIYMLQQNRVDETHRSSHR
jgi:hypothetical protein